MGGQGGGTPPAMGGGYAPEKGKEEGSRRLGYYSVLKCVLEMRFCSNPVGNLSDDNVKRW